MKKILLAILVAVMGVGMLAAPVNALATETFGVETTLIDCGSDDDTDGEGIRCLLRLVVEILTYGVGIAGTLGVIICGIQYLTARDNEAQMTKAKNRIVEIVIGLLLYALMYVLLSWLLPGFDKSAISQRTETNSSQILA